MDCRSLFPFEKVPFGAKVLIYGCTSLGMDYWQQMVVSNYATCLGFVDRKAKQYASLPAPVYLPEQAKEQGADFIVVALLTPAQWQTVENNLVSMGIEKERLVFGGFREDIKVSEDKSKSFEKSNCDKSCAYETGRTSIAFKFNSALGDNIIRKSVVEALSKLAPDCAVDVYSPVASSVLPAVYHGSKYINALVDDGGWLYGNRMKNYDIAVRIETLPPDVDFISEGLREKHPKLYETMKKYREYYHGEGADPNGNTFVNVNRAMFLGQNCYTVLNGGVLQIEDMKVSLKLDEAFREAYERLNFSASYITIGGAAGAGVLANTGGFKQWRFERWQEFVRIFKECHKGIKVIQLGAKGAQKIAGADAYLLGEDLKLVEYVLQGALCHVDIESGLVHLATQLGTHCVVLMGPTQKGFWCYPQNTPVARGTCSSCSGLYRGDVRCARYSPEPLCMASITVNDVLKAVNKFLKERNECGV